MKTIKYFLTFLFFNFLALAVGVLFMKDGPQTKWYLSLNKASWTPDDWVFGAAWCTIMVCFAFYMSKLSVQYQFLNKKLLFLYITQWVLNVSWNYLFFNKHLIVAGLIGITLLWLLIGYFTFKYTRKLKWITLLIFPYLIWMTIATSLNAYIAFYN